MPHRLVIAVSGTPGTGKTSFARNLAPKLGAKLIDLNSLIKKEGIFELDADGTAVADIRAMRKKFGEVLKKTRGNVVVEGLLAHFLPSKSITHVVVLRTRPKVLKTRLKKRGYSGSKLQDNLESEALDIILWEAVQAHGKHKIYEIDTTKLKVGEAVKLFLDAMDSKVSLKSGKVDWLEDFYGKSPKILSPLSPLF
jgi:adenylate kinase